MMEKQKTFSTFLAGCTAAVVCEILFGFSFLFTKTAVTNISAEDLLGWRFAAAALLVLLCMLSGWIRIRLKGKKLLPLLAAGAFFPGAYYFLEAKGVSTLSTAETGILVASVPAITLLLSVIFLGERPSVRRIIGVLISITGVILCTVSACGKATFSLKGYLFLGSGILSFCIFTILSRKVQDFSAKEKTVLLLLEGAVIYVILSVTENIFCGTLKNFLLLPFSRREILYAVLYLASACSVICLFLCNYSISCIGPARFTSFIGIETIVTALGGILILGETLYPMQILGGFSVLAGVYLANSGKKAET